MMYIALILLFLAVGCGSSEAEQKAIKNDLNKQAEEIAALAAVMPVEEPGYIWEREKRPYKTPKILGNRDHSSAFVILKGDYTKEIIEKYAIEIYQELVKELNKYKSESNVRYAIVVMWESDYQTSYDPVIILGSLPDDNNHDLSKREAKWHMRDQSKRPKEYEREIFAEYSKLLYKAMELAEYETDLIIKEHSERRNSIFGKKWDEHTKMLRKEWLKEIGMKPHEMAELLARCSAYEFYDPDKPEAGSYEDNYEFSKNMHFKELIATY